MSEQQSSQPETSELQVAVLGLGIMGFAFAQNLVDAGLRTTVWNRTQSVADPLAEAGAIIAKTPSEAVTDADVVVTMLPTADVLLDVLDDATVAALPSGAIIAQMGTLGVAGTQQIAERLHDRTDVTLVDAPVSGTKGPAEAGTVTILASGTPTSTQQPVLERVFDVIGGKTIWLSDTVGDGTKMKLVVNAWLLSMMQGIAEASILGTKLGISPANLWSALDGGPLASPYIKGKLAKLEAGDVGAEMGLGWGAKDARLALEAFGTGSTEHLPDLTTISRLWSEAASHVDPEGSSYAKQDISAIAEYLQTSHSAA